MTKLIDRENWFDFIRGFFGVRVTNDWLNHVMINWNWIKNEPGCKCSFIFDETATYNFCDDWLSIQEAKKLKEETDDTTN